MRSNVAWTALSLLTLVHFLHGLWIPDIQFTINKGSPIISILNRINPIPCINTYFFKIHSNINFPCLGLPKGLFPVGLPDKILKTLLPSSILATCPAHLNLLDLIETYKLVNKVMRLEA